MRRAPGPRLNGARAQNTTMNEDNRHGETRRIASNTVWLLAGQIIRLGAVFLAVAWTARYLGPEEFGVYSYAIAFVLLFAELGTLGLQGIITHDLVEDPENHRTILGTAFVLRLIGAAATIAILALLVYAVRLPDPRVRWLILVFAAGYMFRPLYVVNQFYESRVEGKFPVIAASVASATLVGLTALLIAAAAPLGWFVAARAVLVALVGILVAAILAVHRPHSLRWRFDRDLARQMLRRSWPLLASAITATIYLKIDQVMLGGMSGSEDVGIYAAASQLSEVWYFLPILLMSSLFPSLISMSRSDRAAYSERLGSIFGSMAWFGVAVAVGVTVLAPILVKVFFGAGFEESVTVLRIHVWALPFIFMRAVLSKWIIIERVYTVSLMTHGAGAVTNVALNLVLIPQYGPIGAAIATVVSYAVASFFSLFLSRRTRGLARLMTRSVVFPQRHVSKLINKGD